MPDIDHRDAEPPYLRLARTTRVAAGAYVHIWDLRITAPQIATLSAPAQHSVEHFLNASFCEAGSEIILAAPMGCATGIYLVTALTAFDSVASLVEDALTGILDASAIPMANDRACGMALSHSLPAAKHIARYLLNRRGAWDHTRLGRYPNLDRTNTERS